MTECSHEPAPRIVPAIGSPLPTCRHCGVAYMPGDDEPTRPAYTYSRSLQIILIDYPDGTEYRDRGQSAADLDAELRAADELERATILEQLHELACQEQTR